MAQAAAVLPAGAQSPGEQAGGEGFRVISMTPAGELPSQVKYPSIQLQFSEPVVALKALGTQSSSSEYLTIEPKLNGVFRWKGTSILSFDSKDEVLPQKEYTIKVSPKLKSVKGNAITGQLEYRFHTEELKLTAVRPAYAEYKEGRYVSTSSVPLEAARDIGVSFNFPVNCAVVRDYIRVTDSGGNELPFTAAQNQKAKDEKNFIRLTLDAQPPEDTDVIVTLKKGAMADRDCYPTSADRQRSFHTLVKFRVTGVDWSLSSRNADDDFPVYISFSAPLKEGSEEELAKSVSTSLGRAVTKDNISVSGSCLTVSGLGVKHGDKYRILIAKTLTDIYGRQLDKDYGQDITVPQPESYALFQNSGFKALEANASPAITFYHQNIKAGSYYKLESLSGAGKAAKTFALDPARIPQDKKITEVVDLRPFLEESGGTYHGAVKFSAHIVYEYAPSWRKDSKPSLETMENEQILQVTDLGITSRYA
ncbi:MAG: Ig-like domain-containing protein, partial [Treponema sp.]|nr:Ig-like domain-containing protein [Treponema sp.]